jgi:predicted lipoprotein with Yx(FWY)xxD motif
MKQLVACAVALAALSGAAVAAPPGTMDTANGPVLTGDNGMTLYTFKKDTPGVSACYDKCAANWPPALAAEGEKAAAPYSIIERKDDTYQWAKDGMPLYYWVKDTKPGDTTGDGVAGVWSVARP